MLVIRIDASAAIAMSLKTNCENNSLDSFPVIKSAQKGIIYARKIGKIYAIALKDTCLANI